MKPDSDPAPRGAIPNGPISEAASEKNGRGRPRALPSETARAIAWLRPDLKTDRARQNYAYARRAMEVLSIGPDDRPLQGYEHLRWLVGANDSNQRGGSPKWAILTELGRLAAKYGDDFAIRVADRACKEKPEVKAGAAIVRRIRLRGKSPRPDVGALVRRLAGCVDHYRTEHPEITGAEILDAINELYGTVQDTITTKRSRGATARP